MQNESTLRYSSRLLATIGLVAAIACISGMVVSCQSASSPPSTSAPVVTEALPTREGTSSEVPEPAWQADGVIEYGEYLSEITYDGYELYWSSDEKYVCFAVKAATDGWVALGIQPGSRMKDADMIFGIVTDGEATVLDSFATDDFGSHPPDVELGGNMDIIEFGGSETDGYTIIEFKRALITGDAYDNDLNPGQNRIIWAYGSTDATGRKHTARGYGEITLMR